MADTILSNGVHLIEGGDGAWKPSTDINLQLFNTLISRVAAVESSLGGASLPLDAVWDDFLAEQTALSAGGLIVLPNGPIVMTSPFDMDGKEINVIGSGPLSALVLEDDLLLGGSQIQIRLRNVDGVMLKGFKLVHNRAGVDRTLAIDMQGNCKNVLIDTLDCEDLTSDFVIMRSYNQPLENICVRNCLVNEWYESYINIHAGRYIKNIFILNNRGNLTTGHPNFGISRPYGLYMAPEDGVDWCVAENVVWAGNEMYASWSDGSYSNSIGFDINGGPANNWCADNMVWQKNIFAGWQSYRLEIRKGYYASEITPGTFTTARRAIVFFHGNKLTTDNSTLMTIAPTGNTIDVLSLGDNDFIGPNPLSITGTMTVTVPAPNKYYTLPFAAMTPAQTESFPGSSATLGGDRTWTEVAGVWANVSGKGQCASVSPSLSWARMDDDLGSQNHFAECLVDVSADGDIGNGVFVSQDNTGTMAAYGLMLYWNASSDVNLNADVLCLFRLSAGFPYPLMNYQLLQAGVVGAPVNITPGFPVKIALRRMTDGIGNALLIAYINDVQVMIAADTAAITGHYAGVLHWSLAAKTSIFDTFKAGTP